MELIKFLLDEHPVFTVFLVIVIGVLISELFGAISSFGGKKS